MVVQAQRQDEFLTREDAAELAKCSSSTIYRLMRQGVLTPYKLPNGGKRVFVRREEVESLGFHEPREVELVPWRNPYPGDDQSRG